MELKKPENIKEVTDEKVKKTTVKEITEELKVKKTQLAEDEARLNSGMSKTLKRTYMGIDKEITRMNKIINMRMIEIQEDTPVRPKYRFELNSKWRAIKREFQLEEVEEMKKNLDKIVKQKTEITERIPITKARIVELEKEMGIQPSQKEKADYIG